jgi:tetratricopeptide (TPR) repeat protein
MLDVVREFAAEQLRECGNGDEVAGRHADYFLGLAERAEPQLRRSAQDRWHRRLDAELSNLRLARRWFTARREAESALRLAGAMWMFWPWHGGFAEGRGWLQEALSLAPDGHPEATAKVLWGAGWLAFHQGDYAQTGALGRRLAIVAATHSPLHQRNGLTLLGMSAMAEHRHEEAVAAFERCVQLCREHHRDAGWLIATSVLNLGISLIHAGQRDRADQLLVEAAHRYTALGDHGYRARALRQRAGNALLAGELERAETLLREGCAPELLGGNLLGTAEALEALAVARAARGDAPGAATLSAAAEALRTRLGAQQYPFDIAIADRYLPPARTRDPLGWADGWSAGAALSTDAVLGLLDITQ